MNFGRIRGEPVFLEAKFFTIVLRRCVLPNIKNAVVIFEKSILAFRVLDYSGRIRYKRDVYSWPVLLFSS